MTPRHERGECALEVGDDIARAEDSAGIELLHHVGQFIHSQAHVDWNGDGVKRPTGDDRGDQLGAVFGAEHDAIAGFDGKLLQLRRSRAY